MVVAAPALSTAAKRVLVLGWFGSTPSAMRHESVYEEDIDDRKKIAAGLGS